MKTFSLLPLLAMAATALLTACQSRPQQADLVLLYTTDVHGACLTHDIIHDRPARTSLANVCTYVNQQRQAQPDAVMLFDTGDYLQGQPSIYYYNYVDTTSDHLVASTYNYLDYDAIGVGNHDIEAGEAVYEHRLPQQLDMPMLCANAIDQRTGQLMFQPYTIVERQGIRIAVLGMITPHIGAWLPRQLWPHLEFQDMIECARQWVPIIRQRHQPDLLVGLFHCGVDYTINGSTIDTPLNENGGLPAAIQVPGFDIVLCGHDHQLATDEVVNIAGDTVYVLDAHTQASQVGRADIHLTLDPATGRYHRHITTSMVPMADVQPDADYIRHFQYAVDTVCHYVNRPLGQLTATLQGEPSLFGPSQYMDFIHDVQLWATKADVSLASVLSPHDSVPVGPLTMRHLFTLYKYENLLFTVRMTGDEIRRYLDFGFDRQFAVMHSASDHLMAFQYNADGALQYNNYGPRYLTPTFNFTCAAGIRYTLDVSRPLGSRVTIHSMSDGSPFYPDHYYSVAINSYQASGGGDFIPVGLGWDKDELNTRLITADPKDVRRYVADYIQEHGTITPHLRGDWQIVPHDWWLNAQQADRRLIHTRQ